MIVVLKNSCDPEKVENLKNWLESQHIKVHVFKGEFQTVFGLIGDTSHIDIGLLEGLDVVKSVKRISEPYKNANRQFHPEDTVITAAGVDIGGKNFRFIAGPCSVESEEQIIDIAEKVKAAGASFLRGGAFKPRTSPYDFQGLQEKGISLLLKAKERTGLPIVTEIMSANHLPLFENVDIIQVGARNMQNFELLKELGRTKKTILLKRGLANTIKELLMSAEYIMAGGNENIILCERGIRTFENQTRNTLDISAVPVLKELSHLPVIVDPSHASGISRYVKPLALAAAAAGAHGVMIEVHNDPPRALCDGAQSVTPEQFLDIKASVDKVLAALKE
ncbi:MAG TPA: 3-deoxy-7-phosphoheptulonate synthase [Bacillota bacterium]|nr:3-deoxy-7-phosphoheptulonate synthase [Bacillota bacterium]HOK69019.1 3-deoxy-7-phosphoheptulonate synthase [Bacillota bacterium]HPP84625.1 3-deoxy-7-phosphoheptulonate synthase [Bacillota bacterium]